MKKQTHVLALMAAALFAVTALTSGGRLQAVQDLPAPPKITVKKYDLLRLTFNAK